MKIAQITLSSEKITCVYIYILKHNPNRVSVAELRHQVIYKLYFLPGMFCTRIII